MKRASRRSWLRSKIQIELDGRPHTRLTRGEGLRTGLLGARPLARVIQTELKDKIADAILFGELAKGGEVRVGLGDDGLSFAFVPR